MTQFDMFPNDLHRRLAALLFPARDVSEVTEDDLISEVRNAMTTKSLVAALAQPAPRDGSEAEFSGAEAVHDSGRRGNHCEQILALLKRGVPVSNGDLCQITARYGARIHDLRKLGHRIETSETHKMSGRVEYRLLEN